MGDPKQTDPGDVFDRLQRAQNAHDLDALLDCFDPDYQSEQPVHPARTFRGRDQVRKNWKTLFDGVRDFRAELIRSTTAEDVAWSEWRWTGTRADGSKLDERLAIIAGLKGGRIAWARLYGGQVEEAGAGIDTTVQRMAASRSARDRERGNGSPPSET
jgi:ketosteroid isomerase-like protein